MYYFEMVVNQKLRELNKTRNDLAKRIKISEEELNNLLKNPDTRNVTTYMPKWHMLGLIKNTETEKNKDLIIKYENIIKELNNLEKEYLKDYIPGNVIKENLIKNNMKVKDLAQILYVSPAIVYGFISGKRKIPQYSIIKICETFNISADELLGIKKKNRCNSTKKLRKD